DSDVRRRLIQWRWPYFRQFPRAGADMNSEVSIDVPAVDLSSHDLYFNRELSHLQFNIRVLMQALDGNHPLLERLRFLCIFSSNLDEFFEIRVAGLKHQIRYGRETVGPDGLLPEQILAQIDQIAHRYVQMQYDALNEQLIPALA